MSSNHLRVISTPLRFSSRLRSPVVAHKSNVDPCLTPLSSNNNIRRRLLKFPSPSVAHSSLRLSPRIPQIATSEFDETASTSSDIPLTHVIPSVSTPDRDHFFKHGFQKEKQWNVLGRGTFGVVIAAKYRDENVAVKIVPKARFPGSTKTIENEKNALGLKHPNIINTLKVINDHNQISLIIMDKLVGLNLQEILDDNSFKLNDSQRLGFALDISHGIEICHRQKILHLDIKPKNVVVCIATNICKICDFGSSERIIEGKSVKTHKNLNTVAYTAPEVLKGKPPTYAADIYSFGITLWQLQTREKPYNGCDLHTIIYKVCNSRLRPKPTPPADLYTKLYEMCWHQEPNFRPHLKYVIEKLNKLKSTK